MPDPDNQPEPDAPPAEPLNRAERRAQRHGKKAAAKSQLEREHPAGHRDQVVVPRRSGRRGNR